jgi:hypothetical protein
VRLLVTMQSAIRAATAVAYGPAST